MRILGIFFYATIVALIGITLIIFALNRLNPQDITEIMIIMQESLSSRLIIGLSGALLILISFSVAQLILGRFQREKTIAFSTASGEVTIALSAVEDLIRRLAGIIPEIKELRPNVVATKKGILVDIRVVLKAAANIPEITSRLQEIARSKIQEVLGIEEQIIIRIHVTKIISLEDRNRKKKETGKDDDEPTIPFSGYSRT
ncbi:MAG: alkaline shock response membrane anchor protein AmaP [Candidatus Omnitrophica bacterium]|nr:alkaline shock response membrane anchor protein AmaP [Candidatus Omnitrophota bacterium]MBU1905562.1 alkaline shock response membrane anchor protein AmaP [Candidatus Omnitrophota bacterium]